MRVGLLVLLFCLLCCGLKNVTPKQLEQVVSKSEYVFVVLYSNMEHLAELSNRVIEEVDRLAIAVERVKFYGLNLDEHPDAVREFGLTDVPTLYLYRDGHPRVYYGQRTGYSIFAFLQELLTVDPVKLLTHKNDKKQFTDKENVKIVGYFSKDNVAALEVFKQAARHFQGDIPFGLVQDSKLAKSFKLKTDGEVAIIKPSEKQLHSQSVFESREEIVDWIKQNQKPLYSELTFNNLYYVWQGSRVTFVAFVKNTEEHASKTILSTFKSLAKEYATQNIAFIIVDTNLYKDFATGLGLKDEDIPNFAIFDSFNRKEHFFPKDQYSLNLKQAKRWLQRFFEGKLETPDQLYGDDDTVVQLNSATFSDTVYDKEKDVLVEFYAPWCGYCSKFAPIYKRIATFMRLLPSTVVATYDVQASPAPEKYNITSLPTLLFFPANNKEEAIPYGGEHDLNAIIDFILEHQTASDEASVEQFKQVFASLKDSLIEEDNEDEIIDLAEEEEKEDL